MTPFAVFSEQPLLRIFGWSLLHFVWQGLIVAAFLACVLKMLSGRSPQLRYIVVFGGLVLMTVLPLISFAYLAITSHTMDHAITYTIAEKDPIISLQHNFNGVADSWLS